jgi:hypothetical protein
VNVSGLSSFGEDAAGCIYAASVSSGGVYRIAPDSNPTPGPCALAGSAPPRPAPTVAFKVIVRKHQPVLRAHRLKLAVIPAQAGTVIARASVRVSRRHVLKFVGITHRHARAGRRVAIRMKMPLRDYAVLVKQLRRRGTMLAKLTVTLRTRAGSHRQVKAIRLVR